MIIRFIDSIGTRTIAFFSKVYTALEFLLISFFSLFSFKDYNSKTLNIFIKEIYLIAIAPLVKFIFLAIIFGSLLIGLVIIFAAKYNFQLQIGSVIVTFVLNEFAPLFTLLFVYFRLVPFIKSKLKSFEIQALIPQLLSGIVSTFLLSVLFAIIMLSSGLIVTSFVMGMDLYTYKNIILDAIEIQNIVILIVKSLMFGFVSAVLISFDAIYKLKTPLMALILNIFFIEIVLFAILSLLN